MINKGKMISICWDERTAWIISEDLRKLQLYINLADESHAKQYVLQEIISSTVRKPFIKNVSDTMCKYLLKCAGTDVGF